MIMSAETRAATVTVTIAAGDEAVRSGWVALVEGHGRLELVGAPPTGSAALAAIMDRPPHLLILDVDLPDVDGFELLGSLPEQEWPEVILVATEQRHALRAYEVGAADCVMKPVEEERMQRALLRAVRSVDGRRRAAGAAGWLTRLPIQRAGRSGFFLPVSDISHVQAYNSYVRLHFDGGSHFLRTSLSGLEARLDPAVFQRVHRSFIVNLNRVREITPRGASDYALVMEDGRAVPLGRAYRDEVLGGV